MEKRVLRGVGWTFFFVDGVAGIEERDRGGWEADRPRKGIGGWRTGDRMEQKRASWEATLIRKRRPGHE